LKKILILNIILFKTKTKRSNTGQTNNIEMAKTVAAAKKAATAASTVVATVTPSRSNPHVMDENTLENHFKQVEDGIMGLSKILSALYLSNLSNSTSTLNPTTSMVTINNGSSNGNSNNNSSNLVNPAGLVVPSISSAQQHFNSSFGGHQHQPSSSVRRQII